MKLSLEKIFFAIVIIFALFATMILAKTVLIPLGFALLLSFILFPLAKKLEAWGANQLVAAFLCLLCLLLLVAGGIFLFSSQIIGLTNDLSEVKDKIIELVANVSVYMNDNLGFVANFEKDELLQKLKTFVSDSAGSLVGKTFSSTANIFAGLIATIVFTFLFLIYRGGFIHAIVNFYPEKNHVQVVHMLKEVQQVGKKYLAGMGLMILVLGLINSIGLWIIGVDNPFLFGFIAGLLAIVPYVGTVVGASLPVLYALVTYDSLWMPFSVVILFWVVATVESNLLSPKIVGENLKINAMASILSIIVGAAVWGVAGMILFLPFVAMLRVICEEFVDLRPIALLIRDHKKFDHDGEGIVSKLVKKIKNKPASE